MAGDTRLALRRTLLWWPFALGAVGPQGVWAAVDLATRITCRCTLAGDTRLALRRPLLWWPFALRAVGPQGVWAAVGLATRITCRCTLADRDNRTLAGFAVCF